MELDVTETEAGIIREVVAELNRASARFGNFGNGHEGYAVILEELDELWAEVKDKNSYPEIWDGEAKQVAAMAIRFMRDVCRK
jgi:hypothetical protein